MCAVEFRFQLKSFSPITVSIFMGFRGWSGGAMVLGKLPVLERPTFLEKE